MEIGFYHPARGYWQTTNEPLQKVLDSYPPGWVRVPLKPGSDYDWDGSAWVKLAPDIEALAGEVRARRDALLAESDWVVTKAIEQNAVDGLGVQIPVVWLDYRQALRDIPQQAGFPETVAWPEKPNG